MQTGAPVPASTGSTGSTDKQTGEQAPAQAPQPEPQPQPAASNPKCEICEVMPRKSKQRFCAACSADITAARRDAESQQQREAFAKILKKGGSELQDLLHAFNSQHPERKKYAHRCKFDWVQYSETKEHRNVVRLGYRAPLLTKEQAVTFWTTEKQMARMAALKRWESELAAAVVKQYDGPNGEVQIPVRVEVTLSAVQLGCSNSRVAGPEMNMTS